MERTILRGAASPTVVAKELGQLKNFCNNAIKEWLTTTNLQLGGHKTEAVLITSRKKFEGIKLNINGHSIMRQQSLKYLGVLIDTRLSYKTHIGKICEKAARVTAALTKEWH